jgi:hypothetical protein
LVKKIHVERPPVKEIDTLLDRHKAWQEEQELDEAEAPLDYLQHRNRQRVQQFREKFYRKGRKHGPGDAE